MDAFSKFRTPSEFQEHLKKFIVDNNIIGTAAGVSIALVTKDVIQSFVGDIVIPSFYFILIRLNINYFSKILPGKTVIDFTNFAKQFISWLLVIIITFLFVKIAFQLLFGVDDTTKSITNIKKAPPHKKESVIGTY
jgi:large-conductance mechanosensitive channel